MIKKLLLILAIAFAAEASAQVNFMDSLEYYRNQQILIKKRFTDSMELDPRYQSATRELNRLIGRSDGYAAFTIINELSGSKMNSFNNAILSQGFSALNSISYRLGFGINKKNNRWITDFNFVFGINNKSYNGAERIRIATNDIQYIKGYDLVHSNRLDVYPFTGVYLRTATIDYRKPPIVNSNPVSIADVVVSNQSASLTGFNSGIMYGLGIDFPVHLGENKSGGIIIGLRGGMSTDFVSDKYSLDDLDINYRTGIRYNRWFIGLQLKFFERR